MTTLSHGSSEDVSKDVRKHIGRRIKELRLKKNMNRECFGHYIEYGTADCSLVAKWETAICSPRYAALVKIADACDVDLTYFYEGYASEQ